MKTENDMFRALERLDKMERELRAARAALEAECRLFGDKIGVRGFRIDHLRIRYNTKKALRAKEAA